MTGQNAVERPQAARRGTSVPARWLHLFGRIALLCAAWLLGSCATNRALPPPPATASPAQRSTPEPRYSDEDAAQELGFSNAPAQTIRSRRRTVQHKSMPLHGAQTQPCAFEDCDISDEDDPL